MYHPTERMDHFTCYIVGSHHFSQIVFYTSNIVKQWEKHAFNSHSLPPNHSCFVLFRWAPDIRFSVAARSLGHLTRAESSCKIAQKGSLACELWNGQHVPKWFIQAQLLSAAYPLCDSSRPPRGTHGRPECSSNCLNVNTPHRPCCASQGHPQDQAHPGV